jgi:hypothetical protein
MRRNSDKKPEKDWLKTMTKDAENSGFRRLKSAWNYAYICPGLKAKPDASGVASIILSVSTSTTQMAKKWLKLAL